MNETWYNLRSKNFALAVLLAPQGVTTNRDKRCVIGLILTKAPMVRHRSFLMPLHASVLRDRARAYARLRRAVAAGKIIKPDNCQLCGRGCKHIRISGHHHRGHEHALDVWWICQRCNNLLKFKHDGRLTFSEAKLMVTAVPLVGFCPACYKEQEAAPRRVLSRYKG